MVVSVVMMFVMGTFKEKHLDGNYCTDTASLLRGYTSQGDHTVTQHSINTAFLSDSATWFLSFINVLEGLDVFSVVDVLI